MVVIMLCLIGVYQPFQKWSFAPQEMDKLRLLCKITFHFGKVKGARRPSPPHSGAETLQVHLLTAGISAEFELSLEMQLYTKRSTKQTGECLLVQTGSASLFPADQTNRNTELLFILEK